jgi:hypothetical protein
MKRYRRRVDVRVACGGMDRSGDLGDVRNGWVQKGVDVLTIENSRRMRARRWSVGGGKALAVPYCTLLPKCYACWPILGNSLRSLTISGHRQRFGGTRQHDDRHGTSISQITRGYFTL